MFVGRARELAALKRALDAARADHGASVLVAGEAGVGKTRLVTELGAHAEASRCSRGAVLISSAPSCRTSRSPRRHMNLPRTFSDGVP
jgi:transcriptional regulator with AAA-type ATPase domain